MVEVVIHHKRHKHRVYSAVIILAIIQITTVLVLSAEITRSNLELNGKIQTSTAEAKDFAQNTINRYDTGYRQNFQTISDVLTQQQTSFDQQIKLLKSSQSDFSGVAQDSVKSVVAVAAGDSMGTGFIINNDGYIVTNQHVINSHEKEVYVLTYDRKKLPAEVVGSNGAKDVALLKIPGTYQSLKFADSSEIEVGQKVIAIGNPLGLTFTVTEGIISGLNRPGPSGNTDYIQTDVPLNPGNSGGPLINAQGKVVGLTNFKISDAESLGFALQSSSIRDEVNLLAKKTIA